MAPLGFVVERRPAALAEVDAAIARLDTAPGIYFGCDAGVAGLHPLQATLVVGASLAIRVFEDGAEVEALDALGSALLRHPALGAFVAQARRPSHSALTAVREFLAAFGGACDAMLIGALRFEAHRLNRAVPSEAAAAARALGVLYFAPTLLRRAASGEWQCTSLRFDDPALAEPQKDAAPPEPRTGAPESPHHRAASAIRPGCREDADADDDPVNAAVDDFAPGGYAQVIARAVERLASQPLVSLTLSQSFRRRVGAVSAARAFATLRRANPAPATFFVNSGDGECLFGASPDLQLVVSGGAVESFPVCGTVARGHGPVGEAESFRQLINEAVDAASLAICTDALRNDLAPFCEPGTLALRDRRRPLALATVVHTVDRLGGRLKPGCDAWDLIVATAAPVMVTGTPRRLALAAIDALEAGPRGWYGGLVVQVGANGDALIGTILRAATMRDGIAEVRTGGDLLADSDPPREEHESRLKAVSLWRALGMPVAADLQAALAGAAVVAPAAPAGSGGEMPRAVALLDAGDPFIAALAETLAGLGLALDASASTVIVAGADKAICAAAARRTADHAAQCMPGATAQHETGDDDPRVLGLVAIGDAAARVLEHAGFAVTPIRPEHGRPVHCIAAAAAKINTNAESSANAMPAAAFTAMRYATLAVDWAATARPADAPDWVVWIEDDRQQPLVLAHAERRTVCMLLRPDSLLADPAARDVLRAAIAFVAAGACPSAHSR